MSCQRCPLITIMYMGLSGTEFAVWAVFLSQPHRCSFCYFYQVTTRTRSIHLTMSSEFLRNASEQRLCNSQTARRHQPISPRNTITPKSCSIPRKFPGLALTHYLRVTTEDIKNSSNSVVPCQGDPRPAVHVPYLIFGSMLGTIPCLPLKSVFSSGGLY